MKGFEDMVDKRKLGSSGLSIAPLVFGGNVFGWTVDDAMSFSMMDRFVDAGYNAIDTADSYSFWVPGNKGGESESVIGRWLAAAPSRRDKIVLFTKVGQEIDPERSGLSPSRIMVAVEDSLRRLKTDYIDVYFSHFPDEKTQVSETLAAYEKLIKQGKVRAIGASNHSVEQLQTASGEASKKGVHDYSVIQPEYNLYDRDYERELRGYAIANDIGVVSYFGLASGFLTGKYKKGDPETGSRAGLVKKYFNEKGWRILDALAVVSARHGCQPAEVALAWLIGSKGVTAPIASATNLDQLESMLNAARLSLTDEDRKLLDVSV